MYTVSINSTYLSFGIWIQTKTTFIYYFEKTLEAMIDRYSGNCWLVMAKMWFLAPWYRCIFLKAIRQTLVWCDGQYCSARTTLEGGLPSGDPFARPAQVLSIISSIYSLLRAAGGIITRSMWGGDPLCALALLICSSRNNLCHLWCPLAQQCAFKRLLDATYVCTCCKKKLRVLFRGRRKFISWTWINVDHGQSFVLSFQKPHLPEWMARHLKPRQYLKPCLYYRDQTIDHDAQLLTWDQIGGIREGAAPVLLIILFQNL